jgi:threonine aldolase
MYFKKVIDLRSDTVTKPSKAMYTVINKASCRDAFLENDSSTRNLERRCADLFGFEDAIFTVSGTMANQLAIKVHTNAGDEVIIDHSYHINYFEAAAVSSISGVHMSTIKAVNGLISVEDISNILGDRNRSKFNNELKLICLENTINYHAGKIFPLIKLKQISDFAKENRLSIHLDGARIFNAVIEEKISLNSFSLVADSMMISFTKGLGAPFGAALLGGSNFINNARRYNKWYGGGMHQSGLMAECALYAINNNISKIKEDNEKAKLLGHLLSQNQISGVKISKVESNIITIDFSELKITAENFVKALAVKNIMLYVWSEYIVRIVTHKDIDMNDIEVIADEILGVIYCLKEGDNNLKSKWG